MVDLHTAYASHLREVEANPSALERAQVTLGRDMVEFLKRGDKALEAARKALAYASGNPSDGAGAILDPKEIRLMSPVPRPGALVSAGKNFSDHVAEMASKKGPSSPVAFLKLPGTVIGPEDDIPYPPEVKNLDYEVELAIIIGKACIDVSQDNAFDYIAGYATFNDISASPGKYWPRIASSDSPRRARRPAPITHMPTPCP